VIKSARVCILSHATCRLLYTVPGIAARDIQEALYKRDVAVQDLTPLFLRADGARIRPSIYQQWNSLTPVPRTENRNAELSVQKKLDGECN
jgi:hypothetical protein